MKNHLLFQGFGIGYKTIVVVVCMLFLSGSLGAFHKMCLDMPMPSSTSHQSGMPDCPTKHDDKHLPDNSGDHCDLMIDCVCSLKVNSVKEQTVLVLKFEISDPHLTIVDIISSDYTDKSIHFNSHSVLYSSPHIFLMNSSLLI